MGGKWIEELLLVMVEYLSRVDIMCYEVLNKVFRSFKLVKVHKHQQDMSK